MAAEVAGGVEAAAAAVEGSRARHRRRLTHTGARPSGLAPEVGSGKAGEAAAAAGRRILRCHQRD